MWVQDSEYKSLRHQESLCGVYYSPEGLYYSLQGVYYSPQGVYYSPEGLYYSPEGLYCSPEGLYYAACALNALAGSTQKLEKLKASAFNAQLARLTRKLRIKCDRF
jgi:hypothetical protein